MRQFLKWAYCELACGDLMGCSLFFCLGFGAFFGWRFGFWAGFRAALLVIPVYFVLLALVVIGDLMLGNVPDE